MAQIIPFEPSTPFYTFACTLAGTQYQFNVRWNTRVGAWYFDLGRDDGTTIVHGIKIVLGVALGRRSTDADFPPGLIFATDTSGEDREAGLDDLGTRVVVTFFTFEELGLQTPAGV
jgi:hypothetical protein